MSSMFKTDDKVIIKATNQMGRVTGDLLNVKKQQRMYFVKTIRNPRISKWYTADELELVTPRTS